jgi:hypothetical protein
MASPKKKQKLKSKSPYCFVSYSSREPEVKLLLEAIHVVFSNAYNVEITPSALESGTSQLQQIEDLIKECAFGIVILDGLRPNVVFEYGLLKAYKREIILLKEPSSKVDILGFWADRATSLAVDPPLIDMDKHFSDVKDQAYARWDRLSFRETLKILWEEYQKKRLKIEGTIEIAKPEMAL